MARHIYRCPLRWADMDLLGHVNNVTYVDYLQEARVDMMRVHAPLSGGEELAEGVVVVRHEVEYLRPLVYRPQPVRIEVWVSAVSAATFTLDYEILDLNPDGSRQAYLRARSVLTPYVFGAERPRRLSAREREVLAQYADDDDDGAVRPSHRPVPLGAPTHFFPCHVRFSDVDIYRHVNNVKYYEYLQEARIDLLTWDGAPGTLSAPTVVVARVDVSYARPILLRPEPYDVVSAVSRIGTSSFTLPSEIRDGEEVLAKASAVVVHVDPSTGRSAPIPASLRERLEALR